jgi:hypothetical protein
MSNRGYHHRQANSPGAIPQANTHPALLNQANVKREPEDYPASLAKLPISFQEISNYYAQFHQVNPGLLRLEIIRRIEKETGRSLICYVTKTTNLPPDIPAYIDDSDLIGFSDLIANIEGPNLDVFIVSNGGRPESAERIVRLLRSKYSSIRFIVSGNAFSAATLICFSGDLILMDDRGTLGPIDPQINGIPARAILRGFETVQKKLETEGAKGLPAYIPLLEKYDLHILEICKSAEELSRELARSWISTYMLKCAPDAGQVNAIVEYFSDFDLHKSHGRSIDQATARGLGLCADKIDPDNGLRDLIRCLANQYEFWFGKSPLFKYYDNSHGINWGRQFQNIQLTLPSQQLPKR